MTKQSTGTGSLRRVYNQAPFDEISHQFVSKYWVLRVSRDAVKDVEVALPLIISLEGGVATGEKFKSDDAEGPYVDFLVVALEAGLVDGGEGRGVLPHLENLWSHVRISATKTVESLRCRVQVAGEAKICNLYDRVGLVFIQLFVK